MERKDYNGWTNYETWNVKLWMDNDQSISEYWQEQAEYSCTHFAGREHAILNLRDVLQSSHLESAPELTGTYADLLNAALSEVNWYEIAEHMVDDYASENPEVFETEEEES
jgi:hypothetical protein